MKFASCLCYSPDLPTSFPADDFHRINKFGGLTTLPSLAGQWQSNSVFAWASSCRRAGFKACKQRITNSKKCQEAQALQAFFVHREEKETGLFLAFHICSNPPFGITFCPRQERAGCFSAHIPAVYGAPHGSLTLECHTCCAHQTVPVEEFLSKLLWLLCFCLSHTESYVHSQSFRLLTVKSSFVLLCHTR